MDPEKLAEKAGYISKRKIRDPEKIKSINDALSVLNNAATEAGEEIRQIITDDFYQLKKIFAETAPTIRDTFTGWKDRSIQSLTTTRDGIKDYSVETAKNLDRRAHSNPWYFMAGAAATSILLGFALGRKSKM